MKLGRGKSPYHGDSYRQLRNKGRSRFPTHRSLIRGRRGAPTRTSGPVRTIEAKILGYDGDSLMARFHELIDRRIRGVLTVSEAFDLERIESRLDTQEQIEEQSAQIQLQFRERQQGEILDSVLRLIEKLKQESPLNDLS